MIDVEHTFSFSIYETPMAKLKMTGKQSWMPKAQKYVRYKEYVKGQFFDTLIGHDFKSIAQRSMIDTGKPIPKRDKKHARMDIRIYFDSFVHADPENIFGGIADALFNDDKYLSGSFSYEHIQLGGTGPPRVDVEVLLFNNQK